MEFGDWLARRLVKQGWSGAELARRMGMHPSAVNKWTAKRQRPSARHVPALAVALGLSEAVVWDAVRDAAPYSGEDILRILNLPPDIQPEEARYLHLAYRAFRTWLEEVGLDEETLGRRTA